jgi:RNA polymerase sigma-70 factor (ECF subfamily)
VEEPDPRIVAAARAGDRAAFERIVRTYQVEVWRLCLHLLRDPGAAEDAAQETFIRVYRFIGRYKGESKFTTWLLSVARNCAHDELRKLARRKRLAQAIDAQPEPGAWDQTLGVEVREALDGLPIELREPIVLIDVFGLSYSEVGRMLRSPEGTIKSRVHRAREQMLRRLSPGAEEARHEL